MSVNVSVFGKLIIYLPLSFYTPAMCIYRCLANWDISPNIKEREDGGTDHMVDTEASPYLHKVEFMGNALSLPNSTEKLACMRTCGTLKLRHSILFIVSPIAQDMYICICSGGALSYYVTLRLYNALLVFMLGFVAGTLS